MPADQPIREIEALASSAENMRVIAFFRRNPGVIETLEGLATRLSTPAPELRKSLDTDIQIGLLRKREIGDRTIYICDRREWKRLDRLVSSAIESKTSPATMRR